MPFVSEVVGRPVTDGDGRRVGRLRDVVAAVRRGLPHPEIVALQVGRGRKSFFIPFGEVAAFVARSVALGRGAAELKTYEPTERDMLLVRDVLDQQLIDTNNMRVVRVNDLELARVGNRYYLANVDIGSQGLLRRLGFYRAAERIRPSAGTGRSRKGTISWDDVEPIGTGHQLRLKVPGQKIRELHPADLAEIISDLGRSESARLLESLDVKTVADTLEEVEPDFQASLIRGMTDEKAADVLEEMAPDEAADLLKELPETRSRELLELMEQEEADDVRKLLSFPEDTAGGIMTTEFVTVRPGLTAQRAIAALRRSAREAETIFYIYVTERDGKLLGVLSLKDLVLSPPTKKVEELMNDRLVTVRPLDPQEQAAQAVAKYNLLAVPVVDEEGRLQGIVTADDALDKIIPTAWKKRLPRLYQ